MKKLQLALMGVFLIALSATGVAQEVNQEPAKLNFPEMNSQRLLAVNIIVTTGGRGYYGGRTRYWVPGHYSYRHGYRHWVRGHYVYRY